jgi:hypothetical protein
LKPGILESSAHTGEDSTKPDQLHSPKKIRDPKAWEKMAAFFAFFAVQKDVPTVLRRLCPPPWRQFAKRHLLGLVNSGDFWWSWLFTIVTVIFLARVLWPSVPSESEESVNEDVDAERRKKIETVLRRHRLIRVARSLGLVLIREKLLDALGVRLYTTFPRRQFAPPVEPAPDRFDYIDRIIFVDGKGCEYQYPRGCGLVFVREHPASTHQYGPSQRRKLTRREKMVLLVGSNFYPFWLLHRVWAGLFQQ